MVANPYYKARHMPFRTGEPVEVWNLKATAWRKGWEEENFKLNE